MTTVQQQHTLTVRTTKASGVIAVKKIGWRDGAHQGVGIHVGRKAREDNTKVDE